MTLYLVFTARVETYDRWRSAFDARSTVHRAAGMTLRSLARGVHDPSFVHVTFELASVEQAESFLAAPDTQAETREGGVTDATYQLIESEEFRRSASLSFAGTVVSCESKFKSAVKRAFVTQPFDANWIVTIDVDQADVGAPGVAGERVSFLVHSPTQLFREKAENVTGKRYRFTIERDDMPEQTRWHALEASSAS